MSEKEEDLKKEFPNGYYVLPSSIHEVLIVDQSFVEEPLDLFAFSRLFKNMNPSREYDVIVIFSPTSIVL